MATLLPPPDFTCLPTGIAVTNRSKEGPLTDVRLSVNNDQFLLKDPLPPIEAGHTLEVSATELVDKSTYRPLALPGERLDCSTVTRIDASFQVQWKRTLSREERVQSKLAISISLGLGLMTGCELFRQGLEPT